MTSRIIAIMPCRNSAWILGLSARALLMWVDHLIILDHCSTDATPNICIALAIEYGEERVSYLYDGLPTWAEMAHRQRLLDAARMVDATHIVTIDDDEVLSGNLLPKIRAWVENIPPGAILQLPWLQLRGSFYTVHIDGLWGTQDVSTAFRDEPAYCWKAREGYDHHHRHPMGRGFVPCAPLSPGNRTGGLMHFQMVSEQRLKWKQFLYKLTERKRWPNRMTAAQINAMYDPTVEGLGLMSRVPESWWAPYVDLMEHLHVDARPWQMAGVKRLLAENPRLADGLNSYGLEL